MRKDRCEICGYEDELGTIKKYHVFPQEIMEQAGRKRSKITRLCPNCQQELNKWYLTNVAHMTYDNGMKRFRAKSPQEMLKEYERAYQWFARHKKEQQKIA